MTGNTLEQRAAHIEMLEWMLENLQSHGFSCERAALTAAIAALRLSAGADWRPIANGPATAGRYLVTNGEDVREARWQPRIGNWVFPSAQSGIRRLTHWQPLPAAPRHEPGEGS